MLYGQNTADPIFYPEIVFSALAFGTMPVSTTVIDNVFFAAMIALVLVSA